MSPTLPSAGALAQLGIQPTPVDTLAAVKRAGFDPSLVASCARPSQGVRGCPMWKECPFHLKKYGGYIPGVRPGEPTASFLDFIMTRLTLAGAIFLTVIAFNFLGDGLHHQHDATLAGGIVHMACPGDDIVHG